MDRGDVWWANLPPPIGRRPVVIVTRSRAVRGRTQVVVAQVTRTVYGLPSEVALSHNDGMPQGCVVNCDVLLTVAKSRLTRRITSLSSARIDQLNDALRFAMDLT